MGLFLTVKVVFKLAGRDCKIGHVTICVLATLFSIAITEEHTFAKLNGRREVMAGR